MALRGGRYELLQSIASGGMATVHLARALGAGGFERLVAIKVMHPHIASEPEFVSMFLDEARLAAQIRHPNVVSTIDVQQDEEGIFLVMDYVEGPSLHLIVRTLRNRSIKAPLEILLKIFLDSLAGLHAAHELVGSNGEPLHLVHRDVSPQNILVGIDGVTRITDFGVARAESRLASTKSGQVKGKAGYIAPEQLLTLPVDRRTDVYAAGVLLWELLTGKRLIQGDSDMEMLSKILTARHPRPREINPSAPAALEAVAMRAIHVDMAQRYPTTAAFAEAVEVAARADGIEIATARGVASFVIKLDAHVGPIELTPIGTMPSVEISKSFFANVNANGNGNAKAIGRDVFAIPAPISSGITPPPAPPPSSNSETLASAAAPSSESGSVLPAHPEVFARRGHRGLLVGIGAGAILTSAIWFAASSGGDGVASGSSGAPAIAITSVRSAASVVAAAAGSARAASASQSSSTNGANTKAAKDAKSVREAVEMKEPKKDSPKAASASAGQETSFRPKDL